MNGMKAVAHLHHLLDDQGVRLVAPLEYVFGIHCLEAGVAAQMR